MFKNLASMKPILVLVLGCLPLAVLTVLSFAGIGDSGLELPSTEDGDRIAASSSVSVPSAQDLADDEMLRVAVAEREFLAGEPLPERAVKAHPVFWKSLLADWEQWSEATQLVRDVLAMEKSLIGAGTPQLESAVARIGVLQDTCRKKDFPGVDRLVLILERRSRELQDEIAFRQSQQRARSLLKEAEDAFAAKDYERSVEIYDQVLERYQEVVDYQAVTKLRGTALFWQEWSKLSLTTPVTEDPTEQRNLLTGFLASYGKMEGAPERQEIGKVQARLEEVNREIHRLEMNEAARGPIAALENYDGQSFGEGLAAASRIAATYPTDWVRSESQKRVVAWLARTLAAKQLAEPDGIEEVETTSGQVLRGFFEAVPDAGGGIIGYKNYPTAEQRKSPTRNVGRYPAADLRGVPNLSMPRQCVDAYESARRRLLADPGNRDCWTALKRTCESAEDTLVEYRRKPGSSREPLSFEAERRFAETVLSAEVWTQIKTIWGE